MNLRIIFFLLSCLTLVSCDDIDDLLSWYLEDSSFQACIWDQAPHCAFTGLTEYKGKYYCCFREATTHMPSSMEDYGKIRILESSDGEKWSSVGLIGDKDYDLRDPKLTVTPDNRLMLLYRCSNFIDGKFSGRKNEARFFLEKLTTEQLSFTKSQEVSIQGDKILSSYWLWRVVWHEGVAYGVAYGANKKPLLVKSIDGINYKLITTLNIQGNEADIEFLEDGRMMIVSRAVSGNGYIGTASFPYTEWSWYDSRYLIHCPDIITLDGQQFVAGRGLDGTMLYHVKDCVLEPIYTFPGGGGDNAYPGVIRVGDELWMSYYAGVGNISIYFAKIPIGKIFSRL